MKRHIAFYSLVIGGLLSGCGDDQRSLTPEAYASEQIAGIQLAVDQAETARLAVATAESNRQMALNNARSKQAAVQEAVARNAKEAALLKKNAESKARWATLTHERADAARTTLLQAALEQAMAEKMVAEKADAVETARVQLAIQQDIAAHAVEDKQQAEQLAAHVLAAERLATLSMQPLLPHNSDKSVAVVTPAGAAKTTAKVTTPKKKIARVASRNSQKPKKHATTRNNAKQPKVIASASARTTTESTIEPTAVAAIAADPKRGHALARKCQLCHSFEQGKKGKFGPNLFAIVGQPAGKAAEYKYSAALAEASFSWNEKELTAWVCNTDQAIKSLTGDAQARTKMNASKQCGQDARDIVAFLSSLRAPEQLAMIEKPAASK